MASGVLGALSVLECRPAGCLVFLEPGGGRGDTGEVKRWAVDFLLIYIQNMNRVWDYRVARSLASHDEHCSHQDRIEHGMAMIHI